MLKPQDVLDLEYPRWAHPPGMPDVLVQDAEGYCAAMNAAEVETETKDDLIARAEAAGITIDKRWGIEKLRAALDDCG